MGPRRKRSAPTWLLLLLAACASPPPLPRAVTVEAGRRVLVGFADTRTGQTFALQNLSSGARTEVYGDASSPQVKVVADAAVQRLVDVLAAQGMFERAGAAPLPGARAVLTVDVPGQRYVWSRPAASQATLDEVRRFDEGRGYVIAVYNSETAYHNGSVDDFRPEDRARIQQEQHRAQTSLDAGGNAKASDGAKR